MISAKEARYLAKEASSIERVIASAAAKGNTSVRYYTGNNDYSLKELIALGYEVGITKSYIDILEISWDKE